MPFIGVAIAAAVGLPAIAGSFINVALAVGLAYVSRSLSGTSTTETGVKTSIELGGDQPRGCVFGEMGTAGQLLYANTANQNNNLLQMVYAIGEGPHDDLTSIWVNGKARTLTLVDETEYFKKYRVGGFVAKDGVTNLLYVYFFHGYQDQPACEELVTWAKPSSRWTEDDRLAGVSYVVVSAFYGEEAFDSGIPRFLFGVRGRRLYDWRLDSTNGGSGAHRWADEKTWQFSRNPIVQLYNFQRGLHLGGELVVGMGTPPMDLRLDLYTAGANACDEPVSTAEGSDADRYVCCTVVSASEEYGSVVERILDSCAGSLYDRVGANGPIVGVSQSVVYPTITDGDLVVGYPVKFAAKQGRAGLVNGVFGSYLSPADQFEQVAYPAQTDGAAESADTEIRRVQADYPQVPVHSQAQRLARLRLKLSRLQATATITLGHRAIVLEPGDWVRWNSARYGDRTYIILNLTQNTDQTVTLSLREVASSAYSWSTDDEQPAPDAGEENDGGGLASGVTGFSLLAITMTGDAGAVTPAVRVFWSPIADPTVTAVLIEYRIVGSTDVVEARATAVNAGEVLLTAGLVSDTVYEMRATIETVPARATTWTSWVEVTTGTQLVPSTPAPDSITPEQFTEATRALVLTATQAALTSLQSSVSQLALIVADVDAAGDLNKRELARTLTVQLGAAVATFSEQITAAVGPDSALVAQITELEAAIGDIGATLNVSFVAAASPAGAIAAYEVKATAEDASAGLRIVAKDDGLGGALGEVWIDADRFLITTGGESPTPVFLVDSSGPTPKIYIAADVIADGTITAAKMAVAELSSIAGSFGEITAGVARSDDNIMRVDFNNARILISSLDP